MKTISILNLKGGVAKTFTAANMAYELYRRGYKVLLIDNDKQGNLSKAYSRYDAENVAPVTRLLAGDWENADELIQHTEYEGIDIVTANMSLFGATWNLTKEDSENQIERYKALVYAKMQYYGDCTIYGKYDYCIIDNPPDIGLNVVNALAITDATVEAAAELTRYLMNKYGVPASHVIRHYDVTGKICPNPYVYNTSAHTWDEFKRKISGQAETPQGGNEKTIWNFLTGKGLNAYAVAGIMGNLYAESGLMPNNLQNTYNNKLGKTDAEYTAAVDNGSYGNFIKDSAGYGLAQWTYWSRKQALLNHAKQAGVSIADLNMQLGFLWEELQGYTAVMDALEKAGSVRAASDAVLTGYEKPADQSETVKKKRAEYGEGYYKKYAAGNGTKYYRVRKSWTDAASQLGAFTSLENAKSACKAGYTVYDDNGKAVYTAAGQQASAGVPFSVQVDILDLNIRTGAGTNYAKTGETTGKGVFTIVEVKAGQGASVGWGRLKSGAGWISLDYATRLA